jgi:acyl-CoA synthetase (AMP-forming)/AMP-acid ligase II
MAIFPLFALFSAALGMTCVIPDMDPTKPAKADPVKILESIRCNNVSFSFGSPALWRVVASHCLKHGIRLHSLKKVLMAGAPVGEELHRMVKSVIAEDGETIIPYGATESLPVANFTGSEMLRETAELTRAGSGYCVGRPVNGVTIRVIKTSESPIEKWDDSLVLPPMEIGETVISGPVVTPAYYNNPAETAMAKIRGANGELWHRIGDTGCFDEKGRLWFCGRKNHRVIASGGKIFYSVRCEALFNAHPDVFRSALVGTGPKGAQTPVIIIEPKPGKFPRSAAEKDKLTSELAAIAAKNGMVSDIKTFLFHPSFPVDIRHNAKIFRERLAVWASSQLPAR